MIHFNFIRCLLTFGSFFNRLGSNSPLLAASCVRRRSVPKGKNRVIPRLLAAGIAIFGFAILFLHDCNTLRDTFLAAVVAPVVAWHPCSDKEAS